MEDLDREASSPQTSPARLQELASSYPRLRPLIAMNPAAYPALIQWLGNLNDPSIKVALARRSASIQQTSGPRRVSVMGREYAEAAPPSPPISPVAAEPVSVAVVRQPAATKTPHQALIIAAVLAVLAVAVVAFIALKVFARPPLVEGEGGVGGSASEETTGESGAPTEGEESAPAVQYPAPSTALELSLVVSPSGNIACELGEDVVACTINSYEFTGDNMASCGVSPLTISTTATEAVVNCAAPAVNAKGATTLSYGDYATNGYTACRSSEYGVSCWNTVSGVGFGIARDGYLIGADGPIAPESFPWN